MNWERVVKIFHEFFIPSLIQHITITVLTLLLSLLIAVPLGLFLTRPKNIKYCNVVLGVLNALQTIPSFSLFAFAMPILGVGLKPAVIVLTLFSIMPILKNMLTGLMGVDVNYIEAAKGMGMTPRQILWGVEVPLAMPVIMTGVRVGVVVIIACGTIAAVVGGGGMGTLIFLGLNMSWREPLIMGALSCATLAIIADTILAKVAASFNPPGTVIDEF